MAHDPDLVLGRFANVLPTAFFWRHLHGACVKFCAQMQRSAAFPVFHVGDLATRGVLFQNPAEPLCGDHTPRR